MDERSARILDEVVLPLWVQETIKFGPKHPVREKLNENYFFADIATSFSELKLNRLTGEKLCEIEAAAKRYVKNVKQTPLTKVLKKPESI